MSHLAGGPGRRRVALWLVGTVVVLVLLFSYRTSTSGPGGSSAPPPAAVTNAPGGPASAAASGTAVVAGPVVQTRWGPVQVEVHLRGTAITDVTVLRQPSGNRTDHEINAYALPRLRQAVLAAQSARVDTVSGATITSDGYLRSLQAALDRAHVRPGG